MQTFQYLKTFKEEVVSAVTVGTPNPGHALSDLECSADSLCIDTANNYVGIGTNNPSKKLEVNGDILVSGTHDVCNGAGACLSQINAFIGSQPIAGGTAHSRSMCTTAGGTLVSSPTLANPVCRFSGATCPSGWTKYENWTTTIPSIPPAVGPVSCGGCTCPAVCQGSASSSHAWGNIAKETGQSLAYLNASLGGSCNQCGCGIGAWDNVYNSCHSPSNYYLHVAQAVVYATITQTGCY